MLIREEHSARIHIVIAVCVLAAGLVFKISGSEWIAVALSIGMVIALETVNSAIENLADFVSP